MKLWELRVYARHHGLPINGTFIGHVSGATPERPELDRLWQAVCARKLDTVLIWKFDRFARSTKQLIDALEEFRHLGVGANGRPHGRPKLAAPVIQAIRRLRRQGQSLNRIARQLGISHQTVANYAPQRNDDTKT